jgi:methionyl-tRNA synthetase
MAFDLIVTTALNYANGDLHLGHLLEDIEADIWVRVQRRLGLKVLFVSGSDAHGTPIMLHAEKKKMTPETLVRSIQQQHQQDLQAFLIEFDVFHSTHSQENKQLTEHIFAQLQQKELIQKKVIDQAYDESKKMFLPDRFIKGTCPKCGAQDQYGDNCEACGTTYKSAELINPYSVLSGTPPTTKKSEHYFVTLNTQHHYLCQWLKQAPLQKAVYNKLQEWLNEPLRDWDISRDAPYFGFLIPGSDHKYFYVWLDAPIGYLAGIQAYCTQHQPMPTLQKTLSTSKMIHFIGKDIIYFHCLFWPAILSGTDFPAPHAVFAHGFLTLNGKKMSKSRGNFMTARDYLKTLNPELLRYYLARKLDASINDLDLNWTEFQEKINHELIGKIINIASRCSKILATHFDAHLSTETDSKLWQQWTAMQPKIIEHFNQRTMHHGTNELLNLADKINQYLAQEQPWSLVKNPDTKQRAQQVCSMGLHGFYLIMVLIEPVLPNLAKQAFAFLKVTQPPTFAACNQHRPKNTINPYTPLLTRVQPQQCPSENP